MTSRFRFKSLSRPHLGALALWTLLWALFWLTILLGLERLPNSDLTGQFDAFARFQAAEMLAGRLPLWSPGSFGGIPFVADTQAAVFYLPRWLTIGLSAPAGFSYYALELEGLLHIWLAGAGMVALVFDITRRWWPSLLAAIAFGLGGYLTSYPLLQLAILETVAWLPLTLFLLRRGMAAGLSSGRGWQIAAGLVLALAFTAGHPQTFLHAAYLAAAYFLFLGLKRVGRWVDLLRSGLLIAGLAIGASAAAWLPALTYLPHTVRAETSYAFVSGGQALLNYVQAWLPSIYTVWTPETIGLPAFLLAIVAWIGRRRLPGPAPLRREILFWTATLLLAAWLSLGDRGILWEAWYAVAPGFRLFRQQERLVGIVALCGAVLAGCGVAVLADLPAAARGRIARQAAAVTGLILLFSPLFLFPTMPLHNQPWLPLWLRQLAVFAAAAGLLLAAVGGLPGRTRASPAALGLLAVLLAGDLYLATAGGLMRTGESPSVIWPTPAWLAILRAEDNLGRIDPGFLYFVNAGEAFDLETVRGISPLKPRLLADLERLPLGRLWPLLHVTHGLFEGGLPADLAGDPLAEATASLIPGETRSAVLYRAADPQPRAWLSAAPVVVVGREAALAALLDPAVDVRRQVVIDVDTANRFPLAPGDKPLPSQVVTVVSPGERRIEVNAPRDAYLVLSEWFLPGWQAEIDDVQAEIFAVNAGLQGIFVPAGRHTVMVRFRPPSVTAGIVLSLVSLLLAAALLVNSRRRMGRATLEERR